MYKSFNFLSGKHKAEDERNHEVRIILSHIRYLHSFRIFMIYRRLSILLTNTVMDNGYRINDISYLFLTDVQVIDTRWVLWLFSH